MCAAVSSPTNGITLGPCRERSHPRHQADRAALIVSPQTPFAGFSAWMPMSGFLNLMWPGPPGFVSGSVFLVC